MLGNVHTYHLVDRSTCLQMNVLIACRQTLTNENDNELLVSKMFLMGIVYYSNNCVYYFTNSFSFPLL